MLLVGGIGVFAYSVIRYAGHDLPELIDDPAVVSTVDTACTSMTAEVAPWIVPVVDGRPITARMNSVGVCAVPATLVSLK